jgi:hypothetical protein
LNDPQGIRADFCQKSNEYLKIGPPPLPEQEYDHVGVSVTEQLRDIPHCPDIATMKYLSS